MQPTRQSPQSQGSGRFHLLDFRHLGKNVVIEPGVLAFHPENIEIGDDVYIGHNAILQCDEEGTLRIGGGTRVGPQSLLHASDEMTIGDDVGIGAGATILGGPTLGSGALVEAGSVVTQDIPELAVVCGVPAQVVGSRKSEAA